MRASQLLLDRSNDVVHAKSVPCECKKWNDFGSQWTAHDLAKRIYDDSPLLQPGNEDFCQVEKSLGCRAAVLGERKQCFHTWFWLASVPGFPRIRGWRHPSLQPVASRDGDGGNASSQETFFFLASRREGFQNQKKLTIRYDR